ncbi:malonic semialdehyde reductase [Undibacterium terreum]|uniref:Putative NADH dehydrogenase/NAD(P)H nitroreductase GCM10011396_35810 n=1 Tax=Undibacterium terreum TaxID=1224302 RepID=A0A916UU97_9BURK|nr:malonic semialdehyde reductase [Undibacterium terreum]GGC85326.1 putative NADH dehydrogenase/NAD(P)H nitroreductase [Undibacterium terreum]
MLKTLTEDGLDLLFRRARSHNGWLERPVGDDLLAQVYDLMKMGPTSVNSSPARFVFLRSEEAKRRLRPAISAGNIDKVMSAPVVAIIAYDLGFHDSLPQLFPHNPGIASLFVANPDLAESTAFRNGSLQGAYFMLAARALGLDCGPISGFDGAAVNREFFPDGKLKVNFLCNVGFGDYGKIFPRSPRLSFEQACSLL